MSDKSKPNYKKTSIYKSADELEKEFIDKYIIYNDYILKNNNPTNILDGYLSLFKTINLPNESQDDYYEIFDDGSGKANKYSEQGIGDGMQLPDGTKSYNVVRDLKTKNDVVQTIEYHKCGNDTCYYQISNGHRGFYDEPEKLQHKIDISPSTKELDNKTGNKIFYRK